ncbi:MAG: tetratricopeptide repeat protein [Rhizomicrobium sp.]
MMWKFNALFCAALAGAAMLSAPARADTQADWFICENDYYNADAAIAACTSVIQSGTVTGADLGEAYSDRGVDFYGKGQYDQAIQDFDQAISLKPNDGNAFGYRGKSYYQLGQYARAIQDFDREIELGPLPSFGYYDRGLAKKRMGDEAGGDADIATAKGLDPSISSDLNP